jgi:hypothetical protein
MRACSFGTIALSSSTDWLLAGIVLRIVVCITAVCRVSRLPLITSTLIEGSLNRRLALMRYILLDMTQIGLAVISTKAFFVQGWNDGNPDRQD